MRGNEERLAVFQASMHIFLQLTEFALAKYLNLCFKMTYESPDEDHEQETESQSNGSIADEEGRDSSSSGGEPFTDDMIDEELAVVMQQYQHSVMQAFNGMRI